MLSDVLREFNDTEKKQQYAHARIIFACKVITYGTIQ